MGSAGLCARAVAFVDLLVGCARKCCLNHTGNVDNSGAESGAQAGLKIGAIRVVKPSTLNNLRDCWIERTSHSLAASHNAPPASRHLRCDVGRVHVQTVLVRTTALRVVPLLVRAVQCQHLITERSSTPQTSTESSQLYSHVQTMENNCQTW